MKDLPILFSGPMVRAILDGRKTMTRRVIAPGHARFQVGRRMWVRETLRERAEGIEAVWTYAADGAVISLPEDDPRVGAMLSWAHHKEGDVCTSIHMPRWASRITLVISAHRVERLHEITEADAQAEGLPGDASLRPKGWDPDGDDWNAGITANWIATYGDPGTPIGHFRHLWEAINGKRAPWADNPLVEVVSFERVQP